MIMFFNMNLHKRNIFVRLREIIFHKKILIITTASVIALFVVYFGFITKKTKANEIVFFPEHCSGSWQNASEVAGDVDDKDKLSGARTTAVGDQIICQSFSGSLPEGVVIQSAAIQFVWGIDSNPSIPKEPSIEESYDPVIPKKYEEEIEKIIEIQPVEIPQEKTNEIVPEILPLSEPTSRLPRWWQAIVAPAHAEEDLGANVETKLEPIVSPEIINELNTEKIIEKNQTPSEDIQSSSETIEPELEANSEIPTPSSETITEISTDNDGVNPAFDVQYGLGESPWQVVGNLNREYLTDIQALPITVDDISSLKVSLTTRLTLERLDNLVLQGVKLIITYQGNNDDKDPIKQPNLQVDTILDDVTVDNIRAIRIIRAKSKNQEIWYQTLKSTDEIESKNSIKIIKKEITSVPTDSEGKINIELKETIVSDSIKPMIEKNTEIVETNLPPTVTKKPILKKTPKTDWNLVATDELIHVNSPLSLQDGLLFWFSKEGAALYSFNILTQGVHTQSYQPENGFDYIKYINQVGQEKKATFDFSNHVFIFSE